MSYSDGDQAARRAGIGAPDKSGTMNRASAPPELQAKGALISTVQVGTICMIAIAITLHVLSAVVWVGGMFAIYMCLRPALGTLDPPPRFRLLRITFAKFLPWVWGAVVLLLASGYFMVFKVFNGFAGLPLYVNLMQALGWLMMVLFFWLFHGPWLAFKRAADAFDWPTAGANLNRIRQIIAINLPLGLIVVIIGASGRFWS
jgi:uncharacterized membrane protein